MTRRRTPTVAGGPLDVHLYGTRVAELTEDCRHRVVLHYTDAAIDRWGLGSRPLTLSMPLSTTPYVGHVGAVPFTEGLLPEGTIRIQTADLYDVPVDDALALLETIGAECAGAVAVVPKGAPLPCPTSTGRAVDDATVGVMLRGIETRPLGSDASPGGVWLSLAGAQPKLLLAKVDGAWRLPEDGAPSTHIIKPESPHRDYTGLPANEAFCMTQSRMRVSRPRRQF